MQKYCSAKLATIVPLCLLATAISHAETTQEGGKTQPRGTYNLLIENDTVARTDRNYTSGFELSYFSPPGTVHEDRRWGLSLGQQIYTPNDTDTTQPLPSQRPYAGWLYAGFAMIVEHEAQLDTFVLNLGVIGPAAQGEWVQNNVHRLIGSHIANGWENQLSNEAGVQLIYDHRWRALVESRSGVLGIDATPHIGISFGNVETYANGGLMLRVGKDLRNDYGSPHIRPSLPGSGYFDPQNGVAWYLFAGVDGRVVGRNIFLDGNTNVASLSVAKKTYVADVQAGLAITFTRLRLAYTYVYRTREFEGQASPDRFGSLALSARF